MSISESFRQLELSITAIAAAVEQDLLTCSEQQVKPLKRMAMKRRNEERMETLKKLVHQYVINLAAKGSSSEAIRATADTFQKECDKLQRCVQCL
jgi:predicted ATP-grasp superfamily ATP-dependent carboligase